MGRLSGYAATFLVVLVAVTSSTTLAALTPSEPFSGSTSLVNGDVYHLFWKNNQSHITFEVHAKVKGWVGFGISPNGGMPNSDIVIGWVKDGVPYFQDRYTTQNAMPTIDQSQDWILLEGSETATHTVLKFQRPLYSCDQQDRNVTMDTMRVIFAYSDTDPSSEEAVMYHGSTRGTKSITLLAISSNAPPLPTDAFHYDYLNKNITIPSDKDTTYWCRGFHAPAFTRKHHLIKVEPIVQPGNEAIVHHILLYACYKDVFDELDNTTGGDDCQSGNMPWGQCGTLIFGWAVGGTDFFYPDHVGFPFDTEEDGRILYLHMETHYDNPSLAQGISDASGFRLWFTPTLRTYDSGVLEVGMLVSPYGHILPAGYSSLTFHGHCTKECLSEALGNQNEIKVYAGFLHTHLLGTGVRVHHYRNGQELPYIDSDMNYDFNYQESRFISPEITIKKGDNLVVECIYNTKDVKVATFGGIGTNNEMCLAFLNYYPRSNLLKCSSIPTQYQMASNLPIKFTLSAWGTATITEGPYSGKSLNDYMENIVRFADTETMEKYQQAILSGQIYQACRAATGKRPKAHRSFGETAVIVSPYTPESEHCWLGGNFTGGSTLTTVTSPEAGGTSIIPFSVLSLLLVSLIPRVF